jgi:cysteinyl-tRNA synthetase
MKPVSEWTDDDLDAGGKSSGPIGRALAAEVLRLRHVDEESLRTIENLNARAEKAERKLDRVLEMAESYRGREWWHSADEIRTAIEEDDNV